MSSTYGKIIKISIFGESHGEAVGAVIDGFPSGVAIDEAFISAEMARRAPGGPLATKRNESDQVKIISGIYNGFSTGAPICGIIQNADTKSKDYISFKDVPRPSHADYTGNIRYKGFNDMRGSGHFSGRLTAPLVFCGAICKLYLKTKNIEIGSHFRSIGNIEEDSFISYAEKSLGRELFDKLKSKELAFINDEALKTAIMKINEARDSLDSVGAQVECAIVGVNPGLGNPMIESIESKIATLAFAVPGIKGIEFGLGFEITKQMGSVSNDSFALANEKISTKTNNNGGLLGGISTGAPIIFNVAFKTTPSIGKVQETLNVATGDEKTLTISGRHDPCIAVRGISVVEAIAAIAICDVVIEGACYE
jgi:chorismate synthase